MSEIPEKNLLGALDLLAKFKLPEGPVTDAQKMIFEFVSVVNRVAADAAFRIRYLELDVDKAIIDVLSPDKKDVN